MNLPKIDSALVVAQRRRLLAIIDFQSLVEDLGRVGRCIHIAYTGVVAAGPSFTELQIKVQRLNYDVTKLCDKSEETMLKFITATSTVLANLESTYDFLLNGFEGVALDTLSSVSDVAGQMAAAAEDLHKSFQDEACKVETVHEETQRHQGKQECLVKETKKIKIEFEQKQRDQRELLQIATEKEQQADATMREWELRADKAIQGFGDDGNVFEKLVNGLTSTLFGVTFFGKSQATKQQQYRAIMENKKEALKIKLHQENERLRAFEKLTEFTVLVMNCEHEQ